MSAALKFADEQFFRSVFSDKYSQGCVVKKIIFQVRGLWFNLTVQHAGKASITAAPVNC